MIVKIMADRFGYFKAIQEMREEWLENLLAFLGVDIQLSNELSNADFLEYLLDNKIEINEYLSMGAIEVQQNKEVVGEWAEPILKLQRDEKGGLYYEITLESWSIIEENID